MTSKRAHLRCFRQQEECLRHRLIVHLRVRQVLSDFEASQLQLRVDMLHNQLNCNLVVATAWNYNISMHHGWCNVVGIRGLHHSGILLEDTFQVATALRNVSVKKFSNEKFENEMRSRRRTFSSVAPSEYPNRCRRKSSCRASREPLRCGRSRSPRR